MGKSLSIYKYFIDVKSIILKNQGHGLHMTAKDDIWKILNHIIEKGEEYKKNYDYYKEYHPSNGILIYIFIAAERNNYSPDPYVSTNYLLLFIKGFIFGLLTSLLLNV